MKIVAVLLTAALTLNAGMRLYAQGLAVANLRGSRGAAIDVGVSSQKQAIRLIARSHGRRRYAAAPHASLAATGFCGLPRFSSRAAALTPAPEFASPGDCSPPEHPPA